MLREIRGVAPSADGHARRWFTSEFFDLFLFYRHKHIASFQLCYDKTGVEHAVHWMGGKSFKHCCVDPGDRTPFRNESPVLGAAERTFEADVVERFIAESGEIDQHVHLVVLNKLREYVKAQANRGRRDQF